MQFLFFQLVLIIDSEWYNIFTKILNFFCQQKVEKNHPQKLLRKSTFSLLPELPKRPKQKNSSSKMWLVDQLYIELGL